MKSLNINLNVYILILRKKYLQIYTSPMHTLTFFLTVMCVILKNPYIFYAFNTLGFFFLPRVAVYVKWSRSLDCLSSTHTQNDLRITNKSNHIPLGKSCGLTNSRKNSCATVAFSASEVEEANQKWRVRLSCVCFPVCADTRNTRNSSASCAGLLSSSTNIEYKKMQSQFYII